MRKATVLAVVVIIVSLTIVTTVVTLRLYNHPTASMVVTVRVTSDPPGATLSTTDQASVLGTTPLTMRYALPEQWRTCVSFDGLQAKWPNGVQLEVRAIELCPDGGMDQEIRLAAPSRQNARHTRIVPSQPNQAEPVSDALKPMDLSVPHPVPAPSTAPARVITTRKTELFVAPAASTETLGRFGPGAVFTVIGTEGDWYLVTYEHLGEGQRRGYIQQGDVRRLVP